MIILNSYDIIKEALLKFGNRFSDRPDIYVITELTKGWGMFLEQTPPILKSNLFNYKLLYFGVSPGTNISELI